MAKRGAQSTLNHLNWNDNEEPENPGEFEKASEDIIKQRVIKKARRRMDGDTTSSVFGAFKGFSSTPLAKVDDKAGATKSFSFLASLGANANGNGAGGVSSAGAVGSSTGSLAPMFSFGSNASATATTDAPKPTFSFGYPVGLKADSTEGSKKPMTEIGISSSKENDIIPSKNQFSFGSTPAKPFTTNDTVAKTFSFEANAAKATASEKNSFAFAPSAAMKDTPADSSKSSFSFGSLAAKSDKAEVGNVIGKDTTLTSPKTTFSFGAIAPKVDAPDAGPVKSTFSFGSGTKTDSTTGATKATFSFGTIPAKSDSTDAGIAKSTFSFGSIPPKSDSSENKSTIGSFSASFGSIPQKSDSSEKKVPFGIPSAKPKAIEPEKKTYSFGVPKDSKEGTTVVDKQSISFGSTKETAEDTVNKMFNFIIPAPKTDDAKAASKKTTTFDSLTADKVAEDSAKSDTVNASKKASVGMATDASKIPPFSRFGTTFGPKTDASKKPTDASEAGNRFQADVIQLNKSFVDWISMNVKENPFCKLNGVFRDYEKHFAKLEGERSAGSTSLAVEKPQPANEQEKVAEKEKEKEKEKTKTPEKPKEKAKEDKQEKLTFSFGVAGKEPPAKSPVPVASTGFTFGRTQPFSFGSATGGITSPLGTAKPAIGGFGSTLSSVPTSSPSFFAGASTFGSKLPATVNTSMFGASSVGGFTFGNVSKPEAPDGKAEAPDGEEDEPPKVEFTPVEEKDSLYSKRCKLFVKAGGAFSDRGIGTLHIKKVDTKVQVLVRAETSIGNILLNIVLNETVPLQRMGKNNVMLVCLPTPESKPPPTSVLLRVKTAEEADELHETLLKYKPK